MCSSPSPPKMPVVPEKSTRAEATKAASKEAQLEQSNRRAAASKDATNLTGPMGVQVDAKTKKKTLLGG